MQQLGVAVEAHAINAMPNLVNGIRYNADWYIGLGLAYEIKNNGWNSGVNTMPIYIDARHYFFDRKWVFALADVGLNPIVGNEWMKKTESASYKKHIGYYGNIGCGVRARLGRETYYSFDISYNFKQTKYDYFWTNWRGEPLEEYNNFKQRRILIRMGMEL